MLRVRLNLLQHYLPIEAAAERSGNTALRLQHTQRIARIYRQLMRGIISPYPEVRREAERAWQRMEERNLAREREAHNERRRAAVRVERLLKEESRMMEWDREATCNPGAREMFHRGRMGRIGRVLGLLPPVRQRRDPFSRW